MIRMLKILLYCKTGVQGVLLIFLIEGGVRKIYFLSLAILYAGKFHEGAGKSILTRSLFELNDSEDFSIFLEKFFWIIQK